MPFENVTREGRLFWLTEASAVLLTDDLNALGAGAITRIERQQAFERLQVPPVAVLTDATMIRIGQIVGAAQVVVGSLQAENDTVVVRARSIALDTGRVQADVTERGPSRRTVRHFRAHRAASGAAVVQVVGGGRGAAPAGDGLRGVHQGAARRDARDGRSATCAPRWRGSRRSTARVSRCGTSTTIRAITRWPSPRLIRSPRSRRGSAARGFSPASRSST